VAIVMSVESLALYNKALNGKTRKNTGTKYSEERMKNMRLQ
jgi:hypothetical protein